MKKTTFLPEGTTFTPETPWIRMRYTIKANPKDAHYRWTDSGWVSDWGDPEIAAIEFPSLASCVAEIPTAIAAIDAVETEEGAWEWTSSESPNLTIWMVETERYIDGETEETESLAKTILI